MNAHIAPTSLAAADIHIVGGLQPVGIGVLRHEAGKALGRERIFGIVLTPDFVGGIKVLGTGLTVRLELDITSRGQKIHDIVGLPDYNGYVLSGPVTDGESVIVIQQARKMPSRSAISLSER